MFKKIKLKVSLKPDKEVYYSQDDMLLKQKFFRCSTTNSKFSNYFLFLFVVFNFLETVYTKTSNSEKFLNKSNLNFLAFFRQIFFVFNIL